MSTLFAPTGRIANSKPVFKIVRSTADMKAFVQENSVSVRGREEAYTPITQNLMAPNCFHLRVYKSPTSALLLPADRRK